MKKILTISIFLIITTSLFSQFRDRPVDDFDIKEGILDKSSSGLLLGLFDPSKFQMSHSFGMSYSTFANNSVTLGTYTNSMFYQFSDKLDVRVDATLTTTPYNSFGQDFADQINGFRISNAEINYRPTEDMFIRVQYNSYPNYYMNPYYNRYSPYRGY